MSFQADREADLDDVFSTSEWGVAAVYRALGTGAALTVAVLPNQRSMQILIQGGNQHLPRRATFLVRNSQIPTPARTDLITIASADSPEFAGAWIVAEVGSRQGATISLDVMLDTMREISGQGVRQVIA